jgi:hypothetical protein
MIKMFDFKNAVIATNNRGTIAIKVPYQDEPDIVKTVLRLLSEQRGDTKQESDVKNIDIYMIFSADLVAEVQYSIHLIDGTKTIVYPTYPCTA